MFIKDIILNGERIVLVPFEAQYLEAYYEISHNRKDLKYLTNIEPNLSLEDFENLQKEWSQEEYQQCLLILNQSNKKVIGDVNLIHNQDMDKKEVEVQLMLAYREDRENGIGKEALNLVEDYIKNHLNVNKIKSKIASDAFLNDSYHSYDFQKKNSQDLESSQSFIEEKQLIQYQFSIMNFFFNYYQKENELFFQQKKKKF